MGTVEDALDDVPEPSRGTLLRVLAIARRLAPDAVDGTGYGMPALRVGGRPLVAVVAARDHLSLFPFSAAVVESVRGDLAGFSLSTGTIRFSAERPLPDAVVEKVVRARLAELGR